MTIKIINLKFIVCSQSVIEYQSVFSLLATFLKLKNIFSFCLAQVLEAPDLALH